MFPTDLITFTKEILNGKLHFLCNGEIIFAPPAISILLHFKTVSFKNPPKIYYFTKSDSVKIFSQKAWLHRVYSTPGLS